MDVRQTAPVDWDGDLVAIHVGGPVPNSPAALMAGTTVPVTASSSLGEKAVYGVPGFPGGIWARLDGSTRTHWRIANAA